MQTVSLNSLNKNRNHQTFIFYFFFRRTKRIEIFVNLNKCGIQNISTVYPPYLYNSPGPSDIDGV